MQDGGEKAGPGTQGNRQVGLGQKHFCPVPGGPGGPVGLGVVTGVWKQGCLHESSPGCKKHQTFS